MEALRLDVVPTDVVNAMDGSAPPRAFSNVTRRSHLGPYRVGLLAGNPADKAVRAIGFAVSNPVTLPVRCLPLNSTWRSQQPRGRTQAPTSSSGRRRRCVQFSARIESLRTSSCLIRKNPTQGGCRSLRRHSFRHSVTSDCCRDSHTFLPTSGPICTAFLRLHHWTPL